MLCLSPYNEQRHLRWGWKDHDNQPVHAAGQFLVWYTWESMYRDENGIQSAQSLIYTYQQELWEYNWSQPVCSAPDRGLKTSEKMYHLENKLSAMGYHFQIMKNGNEIYSNMEPEDTRAVETVAGEAIASAKTLTASKLDISVIKNIFYHGTKTFLIIAVLRGGGGQQVGSYLQSYLLKFVIGFVSTICFQ